MATAPDPPRSDEIDKNTDRGVILRKATGDDFEAVKALLSAENLPTEGLEESRTLVLVQPKNGIIVASGALERYDRVGLLRSVVVAPSHRGVGLARLIVDAIEELAVAVDTKTLYLFTATAANYFSRLGWQACQRGDAPAGLKRSTEWSDKACAKADLMSKEISSTATEEMIDAAREHYTAVARDGQSFIGHGTPSPLDYCPPNPGDTVLDLGSGIGEDALIAAERVGAEGKVIGIDVTPSMVERARGAATAAGATNVEIRQGQLEKLPVDDASIDLVVMNCSLSLTRDKDQCLAEAIRVLKPGARITISEVLPEHEIVDEVPTKSKFLSLWMAFSHRRQTYLDKLNAIGFTKIEVLREVAHPELAGLPLRSIIICATKPKG